MIQKSRILDSTDWGANTSAYNNTNSTWPWNQPWPDGVTPLDNLKVLYYGTPRIFTTGDSVRGGKQEFSSTTFRRPIYNDCSNYKSHHFNYLIGSAYQGLPGLYSKYVCFRPSEHYTLNVTEAQCLPLDGDVDLTNARSRAWWELQPRFEGEFDALNFLFELKDFRDLAKFLTKDGGRSWSGFLTNVRKVGSDLRKPYARKAIRKSGILKRTAGEVSSIADGIASLTLLKRLAIDPFVRDVAAYVAQLRFTVNSMQKEFADNGLNINKRHYSEVINEDSTILTQNSSSSTAPWLVRYKRNSTKFTASMQYSYDYTQRATMAAFVKYWGLEMSAETFWNSIPFSFVVDYFLQIAKALHAMEIDKNVDLRVVQYCESLLKESIYCNGVDDHSPRTCHCIVNDEEVVFSDGMIPIPVSGWRISHYVRQKRLPYKGLYVPILKNASNAQCQNIAALVKLIFF